MNCRQSKDRLFRFAVSAVGLSWQIISEGGRAGIMTENETQFIFHIISWVFFVFFYVVVKSVKMARARTCSSHRRCLTCQLWGSDSPVNAIYRIRARAVRVKMHLLHFLMQCTLRIVWLIACLIASLTVYTHWLIYMCLHCSFLCLLTAKREERFEFPYITYIYELSHQKATYYVVNYMIYVSYFKN